MLVVEKTSFRSLRKYIKLEDKWILSKTEALKKEVKDAMDKYDVHLACRAIDNFILEDLSRWYVRMVRDRTWVEGDAPDKLAVHKTLHEVLMTLANLMAPFTPHMAEELYQNLEGKLPTIFMAPLVKYDKSLVNEELNQQMDIAREIVERVHSARQKAGIKLRWPVKLIVIKAQTPEIEDAVEAMEDVILRQSNAKALELVKMGDEWTGMELEVKPNMEVIGPVFRQWASKIAALLQYQSARRIKEGIEKGEYSLGIEGQQVKIMPNMVSFKETLPKGIFQEEFGDGSLFLDTEITDEIKSEGFAKEIIRRVQEMRKEMDLRVEEEINAKIKMNDNLYDILESKKDYIAHETRSANLDFVNEELAEGYIVEWNAEGQNFTISVMSTRSEEEEQEVIQEIMDVMDRPLPQEPPRACVTCGKDLTYIEEYKRWYCYNCKKYAEEEIEIVKEEDELPPSPEELESYVTCGICGASSEEGSTNCSKCGASLIEGEPEVEEVPQEMEAEADVQQEIVEEAVEEEAEELGMDSLFWGGTHLIKSEIVSTPYKLIEEALTQGHPAICFTRDFPKKLRSEYNLEDIKIFWLSNIGKEDTIRPRNLEKLSLSMEQFLARDEQGVILLSGIEYLVTNNNFLTVLRLIQSLRDQVAISNSILIIPVNPQILEQNQLKLLEREVDVIL
jgi:isoleucyl-tRNA synthetase